MSSYTFSQKKLLEQEITRLCNIRDLKDESIRQKLVYYKKLLRENNFINPIDNNTIGIGTQFSIDLIRNNQKTTKRLEMINKACCFGETTDEFMERISTVGFMVYGLGDGDTFGNQLIHGMVYDIDNSLDRFVTIVPEEYQKRKLKK